MTYQVSERAGWISVIGAIIFFGSCCVPLKVKHVMEANADPLIYQLYQGIAIFAVSWVSLAYFDFQFSWFGVAGAALWVPANIFAVNAIQAIGLSIGNACWAGLTIVISFMWGSIVFQQPIKNLPLTLLGLALIGVGLIGIGLSGLWPSGSSKKEKKIPIQDQESSINHPNTTNVNYSKVSTADGNNQYGSTSNNPLPETPEERDSHDAQSSQSQQNLANYSEAPDSRSQHVGYGDAPASVIGGPLAPLFAEGGPLGSVGEMWNKIQKVVPIKKIYNPIFGAFCILGVGVFNGSMMVPARFDTSNSSLGSYMCSFGIGVVLVSIFFFILNYIIKCRLPRMDHMKLMLIPGLSGGVIWTIGNLFSTIATLSPLGLTIGFPLTQFCLLLATAWSVAFGELSHPIGLAQFVVFVIVFLLPGVFLLALFGKA